MDGEGNGTPIQYSCLENTMDGGAWWAAVHGVTQSDMTATSLSLFTFMHWRRKWQPTPVILPGKSQGWWSLVGCRLRGGGPGNRGRSACGPTHVARLEFPRATASKEKSQVSS